MAVPSPSHPILLLKTPSPNPTTDVYTAALSQPASNFNPHYIPVLSHTLLPDPLIQLLLTHLSPTSPASAAPFPYGALILTSQRAVAALSTTLNAPPIQNLPPEKLKQLCLKLYTVGPATAKATREVASRFLPSCNVYGGEKAGSGEVLARLILEPGGAEDYNGSAEAWAPEQPPVPGTGGGGEAEEEELTIRGKKPVLFLVGEKRRDVIPRMLQDLALGDKRMKVDEMVVYQSGELEEFEFSFSRTLALTTPKDKCVRWIVVFSSMAGKGMLKELGWLDEKTGRVRRDFAEGGRETFVACIGPTTWGYLREEFGFEADVVAAKPSPEGLREGIEDFMRAKAL